MTPIPRHLRDWLGKQRRFDAAYGLFDGACGQLESVVHEIAHGVVLELPAKKMATKEISEVLCRMPVGRRRDWQEVLAVAAECLFLADYIGERRLRSIMRTVNVDALTSQEAGRHVRSAMRTRASRRRARAIGIVLETLAGGDAS